jgi:endonuclease/exonuclease/phosphatase family metal-dependent hydrolase
MSPDIVGLQDLDLGRARSAHADQAALIADQLGWKYHFHPAMRSGDEQYGNAIVSRYPIMLKRAGEMPGCPPWFCREQRIALWISAETDLGPVHIINTHFGLGRTERKLQAQLLTGTDWLGAIPSDQPAVLLGDFNSVPRSSAHRLITTQLCDARTLVRPGRAFRTFPTRLPSVAVDHIFVNAAVEVTNLEVHRTPLSRIASDHYPLVCTVRRERALR